MNTNSYKRRSGRITFSGLAQSALAGLALLALSSQFAFAAPLPKPACGTSGPLVVDPGLMPSTYTYTTGDMGSQNLTFTVKSPGTKINSSCDNTLPLVFGNGNGVDPYQLPVTVSIGAIEDDATHSAVDAATHSAIVAAITGSGSLIEMFDLMPPGTGTHDVAFTFNNSIAISFGTYDVEIKIDPENSVGVGTPSSQFLTLTVSPPTTADTLPPTVAIQSPVSGANACLNGTLSVAFTAIDPPEGGAGTGITAMGATVDSAGSFFSEDITGVLVVDPSLSQQANVLVTATASVVTDSIGSFVVTATADDDASHQGQQQVSFSVTANVLVLPPIAVPNKQFKVGSTVPIKWTLADCEGNLLPPFTSIAVEIDDSNGPLETRYAGNGSANIRWDLDDSGNVTQYITNFDIPAIGTYTVKVFVADIDGTMAQQGTFDFLAASKGGKN